MIPHNLYWVCFSSLVFISRHSTQALTHFTPKAVNSVPSVLKTSSSNLFLSMCLCAQWCIWLSVTLWTVACQAPLSMGFSRPEKYWSRLPFPFPGDLPDPGIEPSSHMSPMLQPDFYHWATREAPFVWMEPSLIILQGLPQIHFLSKTFPVPFIPRLWTPNTQFRVGHRFGSLTVCLIYSLCVCVCVCVCVGLWVCVPIFWHLEGT